MSLVVILSLTVQILKPLPLLHVFSQLLSIPVTRLYAQQFLQ